MSQLIKNILWGLLFLCSHSLFGNDNYITEITHYGVKDGLSHRLVKNIYEDSRGFIWLATKYGLNRFDGKKFQNFTKEKQGLPSNYIHSIHEDKDGWLWISFNNDAQAWSGVMTLNDITVINIYTLEVKTLDEYLSHKIPFKVANVTQIAFLDSGTAIFMTRQNAFYKYDKKTGFKKVNCKSLNPFIITDKNTLLGVTADYAYQEVNLSGKILQEKAFPLGADRFVLSSFIQIIPNFKYQNEYLFYYFFEDKSQSIFSTSKSENLPIIKLHDEVKVTRISDSGLYYDEKKKWFWNYSENQLKVFSQENGLIHNFSKSHPKLSKNIVYDIAFTNNITWIATDDGLFKVKLVPNPFIAYFKTATDEYSINTAYSCRAMLQVKDTLYVNVTNAKGSHLLNLKTGAISKINLSVEKADIYHPKAIFKDNKNNIWLGLDRAIKLDRRTGQPIYYNETEPYIKYIWSIYQAQNGTMWFGGDRGLGFLDEENGLIHKNIAPKPYESLNEQNVYTFLEIAPDNVFLATFSGIYQFNPLNQKIIKRYWTGGKGDNYFPHDNIYHLHKDNNGIFWAATGGGGLIRWEQNDGKNSYQEFTIADGLSSNTIYAVYEDKQGNLWMSSDYGIIQFNKTTFRCKAYLPEDGVNQEEFNRISHYQAPDERLYFGGLNGVTAFYPEAIADTSTTSSIPLEIMELLQYSAKANTIVNKTTQVIQSKTITLQPGDRFFDLKFALLNFENTAFIRYAYRINSISEDWNYSSENSIRISGLPYGEHQLTVRGQSSNGQFSTNEIRLTIQVIRPIYLRWWFLFLCLSAIIASAYAWYQWRTQQLIRYQSELENEVKIRTKKIEKQAEELKDLDQLKSTFFANISHELRTPLTLMLAPIDAALKGNQLKSRELNFLQIAKQNGRSLLKLINSILDLTKLEANKLKLQKTSIPLFDFVRRVVSTFESYAQNQGVNLLLHFQAEKTLRVYVDRNKLETILNNLLSNAIKFTPSKGEVNVLVTDTINDIQIEVSDTGRGIHTEDLPFVFDRYYQTKQPNTAAEGGTGIGLALVKELVDLFGGSIEIESELGKGTVFKFKFPRIEAFETTPVSEETETDLDYDFENDNLNQTIIPNQITNRQILIVEDNPTLRNFIKTLLNHHQIVVAGNGQEALTQVAIKKPDLIISDVMMPIMDGFQLLEQLKTDENYRHIPILMLTARASMKDKLKALRIGVDDYMTKPFEQDELYARVNNLLKNTIERSKWIEEAEPELEEETTTKTENITENKSPKISDADKEWLETLETLVEKNIENSQFNTYALADELLLSRSQLFRKMKKLTGLTPSQYIQEVRLQKAYQLFNDKVYDNVKAVALSTGFAHRSSFAQQFKKRFGKLPSEFLD